MRRHLEREAVANGIRVVAENPERTVLGYALYDLVVDAYDVASGRRIGGFSQAGSYVGGTTKRVWTQLVVAATGTGSATSFLVEASLQTSNPPSYTYQSFAWSSADGVAWRSVPPPAGPGAQRFSAANYTVNRLLLESTGAPLRGLALIEQRDGPRGGARAEVKASGGADAWTRFSPHPAERAMGLRVKSAAGGTRGACASARGPSAATARKVAASFQS